MDSSPRPCLRPTWEAVGGWPVLVPRLPGHLDAPRGATRTDRRYLSRISPRPGVRCGARPGGPRAVHRPETAHRRPAVLRGPAEPLRTPPDWGRPPRTRRMRRHRRCARWTRTPGSTRVRSRRCRCDDLGRRVASLPWHRDRIGADRSAPRRTVQEERRRMPVGTSADPSMRRHRGPARGAGGRPLRPRAHPRRSRHRPRRRRTGHPRRGRSSAASSSAASTASCRGSRSWMRRPAPTPASMSTSAGPSRPRCWATPRRSSSDRSPARSAAPALQTGEVDVLIRNTTWTVSRDATWGQFAPTTFYDGQAIMVRRTLGVTTVEELAGATVCVQSGTTTELNLTDAFRARGLDVHAARVRGHRPHVRRVRRRAAAMR